MNFPSVSYFMHSAKMMHKEVTARSLVFWDVRHVVTFKWTNVSEMKFIALMMEAVHASEMSVHFHVATWRTSQKTLNFILAAVRT
jgi:hypothetical protein